MENLAFLPAVELAALIRRGETSSRELVELHLRRLERLNPGINAVVSVDADRALREADEADKARALGKPLGALHGIPITVKDLIEAAGLHATAGSAGLKDYIPIADATAVARLKRAGAVVYGKTNVPLFGGYYQTYNALFGTTNNPWDVSRSPGGSCGGSAAAVAGGLSALDLGSDGAGSLRNPAHYCGVYSHKPSFGLVPSRPGEFGPKGRLDMVVFGPTARSPEDLAACLEAVKGPDTAEENAWRVSLPPPRHQRLKDFRIAAWLEDEAAPVDAQVSNQLRAAVSKLKDAGAQINFEARPEISLGQALSVFRKLLLSSSSFGVPDDQFAMLCRMAQEAGESDDSPSLRFARWTTLRHRDWLFADGERARIRAAWDKFFKKYDVVLCPVTPVVALKHDHSEPHSTRTITINGVAHPYFNTVTWLGMASLAYLPATVAPAGLTPAGLPVGMQILGPYLEDLTTIGFAASIAEVLGGFSSPPGFE